MAENKNIDQLLAMEFESRKSTGNIDIDSTSELTVFEETLTEEGLAIIKKEADELPEIAKTDLEYNLVYEFNTRLKRVSVAARKKEKALQKDLKMHFSQAKNKIAMDLSFVIDIITPIIAKTIESRDYLECWKIAIKENKARDEAEKQRLEFERQEKIRRYAEDWDNAHEKNRLLNLRAEQALEKKKIKENRERLKRERIEFEIEKGRLSVDECWDISHMTEPILSNEFDGLSIFIVDERLSFDDAWEEAHLDWPDGKPMSTEDIRETDLYKREQEKSTVQAGECLKIINDHVEDVHLSKDEKVVLPPIEYETMDVQKDGIAVNKGISVPFTTEILDFQQIMTEKVEDPEPMSDTGIMEQIRLSAGIFRDEIKKHLESGFQGNADRTKVYNFFLTLKMFIDDISNME